MSVDVQGLVMKEKQTLQAIEKGVIAAIPFDDVFVKRKMLRYVKDCFELASIASTVRVRSFHDKINIMCIAVSPV